ncbi:MAG: PD-(D/E)XK nuclease family protein [Planctomycetota bacterium]
MNLRSALNEILADPNFHALERRLRDLSAFHVLAIDRREISHAALLAWLLDPRASHGAGSDLLRSFMLLGARGAEAEGMLDVLDVDELDLDAVTVTTEHPIEVGGKSRRLDVLVTDAQEQPLLIVEYKVDAAEGEDQTADYATWAAAKPVQVSGDRKATPLLVFLCPSRDGDHAPAPPFAHLRYEPYLEWLADVRERMTSPRARFLVEELRACLIQRDDVSDLETRTLVQRLERARYEALDRIRQASKSERAAHDSALLRHREAFAQLGIVVGRRFSLGGSAFLAALREELAATLTPELWSFGSTEGSINLPFRPMQEALQALGGGSLRVTIWSDRPKNGRGRVSLAISGGCPGQDAVASRALRIRVADSLRAALRSTHEEELSQGQTILRISTPVPGIVDLADDTPTQVEPFRDLLALAAGRIRDAEAPFKAWVEGELAGLLQKE